MTEPTSARSALNLRLVLAASGAVLCALLGVLAVRAGATFAGFALLVLAFAGAVDAVVVLRRTCSAQSTSGTCSGSRASASHRGTSPGSTAMYTLPGKTATSRAAAAVAPARRVRGTATAAATAISATPLP